MNSKDLRNFFPGEPINWLTLRFKEVAKMQEIKRLGLKAAFVVTLIAAMAVTGLAAEETTKFPTKPITFIVPVRPGGGIDTYTRLVAPYLEKYLPNQPKIIVKNMPGADKAAGTNACLRAEPDGHTIVTLLIPGQNLDTMLGLAKYDLNTAAWIGAMTRLPNVFTISAGRPERSLKDLQQASKESPLKSAISGLNSPAGAGSIIASEILGLKTTFIPHEGSAPAVLSTIRGTSDYMVSGYSVLKSGIENRQLIPLWVYSGKRFKYLPDIPTIVELGYPQLVPIFDMYYAVGTAGKVPEAVLTIWREALKKAVEDPGFDKAMEKAGSDAVYTSGEDMIQVFKKSNELYAKYMSILKRHK